MSPLAPRRRAGVEGAGPLRQRAEGGRGGEARVRTRGAAVTLTAALDTTLPAHERIKGLLPPRYPMLLVDAVRELRAGESIRAAKAVTLDEPAYARTRRGAARAASQGYPTSLVIESFCQTAGILFMESGLGGYDRH